MTTSEYARLSQKSLQEAEALLTQGDYHQASERFWLTAEAMVKAVAERRRWPHANRRELHEVITRLARETGRQGLMDLFGLAGALQTNFCEDWLPPDQVTELATLVRELLSELGQLTQPQGDEEHGPGP